MRFPVLAGCSAALVLAAAPAFAATDITVWHSMKGAAGETFTGLVDRYNAEQKDVHVTLVYKGDARATVDAGVAVAKSKAAPDLIEVQDELTGRLVSVKDAIKPMYDILPLAKSPDFSFFIPGAVTFMKDARGKLYGFPFSAYVPVYLYNRDAYVKVGLDPDQPPRTWVELQKHLVALQAAGYGFSCPYTTSEQSWIHVENLAAWHGELIATRNNGLDGPGAVLTFNDLLHVRHIARLESWVKSKLFDYSGHEREGDARFAAGDCATLTTGSDALANILKTAKFSVGVAPLPFYEEGAKEPVNTFVGGSAFWAMEGKKPEDYKASARFLAFLSTPVIAAEWAQKTGTLPITEAAYLASEKSNAYEKVPGLARVMKLAATTGAPATRGFRLPVPDKLRDVIDAELEAVWADKKPPKQGLDDAVREGNLVMRQAESPARAPAKAAPSASATKPSKPAAAGEKKHP